MFSYSGRVKSPQWRRRQLRRADLRQFYIFRHGPIIIYTRLPAGGTYYPICMFPANSERLIGISDAFSAFVYGYPSSCPRAQCTPNKSVTTLRYTRRHGPVLGDSGGVVNSLDFCPASLKSLGCFYFQCVLSSQWMAVTVNLRILHCQP